MLFNCQLTNAYRDSITVLWVEVKGIVGNNIAD